ncbi:MAG TPA: hypothetical protein PK986_04600 [Spirochaetota bacterium]|nr:hypothetical protein [Spirochaetota bacterium]HQO39730.1 hypothetical protein [Spirochaetota bacterium]
MKIRYSVLTALFVSAIMFFISCDNPFSRDWAAKIGSETITMKELNRFYYTQNKLSLEKESNEEIDKLALDPMFVQMHPTLNKQLFLDSIINGKVVYNAAMEDSSIDRDEMNAFIELQKYQIVTQYYLYKKLKSKIVVTEDEVNEYYTKYKSKLSKYTANEAIELCRKDLQNRKLMYESNRYVDELKQKSGVNRDGFKEYMTKQGK